MDFEIIHDYSVSYSVTMVHSESGESGETMMSPVTSLNISQLLDNCRRQEFTVQTVVNDQYFSQPESLVHEPNSKLVGLYYFPHYIFFAVPYFIHLSAMFEYSALRVQVSACIGIIMVDDTAV